MTGPHPTVQIRVPASSDHLSLLRTVVGGCAGREEFTLDQVDDLRMAVDEAAVQLLRQVSGEVIELDVASTADALEVRVSADTNTDIPVIDRSSFSWAILQALADELDIDGGAGRTVVLLRKHRLTEFGGESQDPA